MTTYTVTLENGKTHCIEECGRIIREGKSIEMYRHGGIFAVFNNVESVVEEKEKEKEEEDLNDPANWREGDVFVVTNGKACGAQFEDGDIVKMGDTPSRFCRLDGESWALPYYAVRFHHRP